MKNNEDGGHREKNDEKPDISISHYKNELYNFLRFIAFTFSYITSHITLKRKQLEHAFFSSQLTFLCQNSTLMFFKM